MCAESDEVFELEADQADAAQSGGDTCSCEQDQHEQWAWRLVLASAVEERYYAEQPYGY